MEKETETRKKLLECGKREFIEKGYQGASLRNICKAAGVTTGALYFFFKNKEELFEEVVREPLQVLNKTVRQHFDEELKADITDVKLGDLKNDYQAAVDIVKALFRYRDVYLLVINNSHGSRYEDYKDRYVDSLYDHYLYLFCKMKGYENVDMASREDRFIVHWMTHDQFDIFIHMMVHCEDEEEALKHVENMFNYMVGGWFAALKKQPL